jgi:hypothetical protein
LQDIEMLAPKLIVGVEDVFVGVVGAHVHHGVIPLRAALGILPVVKIAKLIHRRPT